jgi:hypothetical protein
MKSLSFRIQLFAGLLLFMTGYSAIAQKTPNQILAGVHQKMLKVKDYSADVNIRSEIPMIKIAPVDARVYFKQKDKFKMDSKGIAILPKQGFGDLSKIIRDTATYTAVFTGKETINNTAVQVVNVIPGVDTSDLILAKLWIDVPNSLVLKSQLTTRSSGTILIEYAYGNQRAFGLPDDLVFTIDVKKFKIPKGMATDINKSSGSNAGPAANKGQIFAHLTNYRVNEGVSDAIFKK